MVAALPTLDTDEMMADDCRRRRLIMVQDLAMHNGPLLFRCRKYMKDGNPDVCYNIRGHLILLQLMNTGKHVYSEGRI